MSEIVYDRDGVVVKIDREQMVIITEGAGRVKLFPYEVARIAEAVAKDLEAESAAECAPEAGHSDIGGPACPGVWDGTMWDDTG